MSKGQIILLEEAIQKGIVKMGDYLDYRPFHGTYSPPEGLSKKRENPIFTTENFGWKLDKIDERLMLAADGVTAAKLWLFGRIGYDYGVDALNSIAGICYTDPKLADKAVSMTGYIYKNLSPLNALEDLSYWLGSTYLHPYAPYTSFGLSYVYCEHMNEYDLFYSSGCEFSGNNGVRPAAYLKPNITLVLSEKNDGTKEKPWMPLRD